MTYQRDPVSVWFDAAAVRLLERAYANRGEWTGVYLAPPTPAQRARLLAMGVNPAAVDRWGEVRWVRAFKRSCFWHLRQYGYAKELRVGDRRMSHRPGVSVEWQTGARVLRAGWPSRRWAIRIMVHPGGRAATAAARAKTSTGQRWIEDGHATGRQFRPDEDMDWGQA